VLGQPLDLALTREWLVTDGLGGYASGTVPGVNTRRYHGLLVAPLAPPLGRHVLLSKLEETLRIEGHDYSLSPSEFEGSQLHPRMFSHLSGFALEAGLPVWRYTVGASTLEKRVRMERGRTATYVSYRLDGPTSATLTLTPLCSFREFHHETVGSDDWHFRTIPTEGGVEIRAYAGATPYFVLVHAPPGRDWRFAGQQGWWWHFLHREERSRGQDFLDDAYAMGQIECELHPGEVLTVVAALERDVPPLPLGEGVSSSEEDPFVAQLRRAAHQFLVARPIPGEPVAIDGQSVPQAGTVLAGYHWFGDWGRDTFIALPGLARATGRLDECRAIARSFARYVDRGMLPNRFPDTGAPLGDGDYNTVDATLWYIHAVAQLDRLTGGGLVQEVYATLAEIIDWHITGTRFGIVVDLTDGLLRVENPQLTWMDAKVGGWDCTPRDGKPVEIQALWHHALVLMEVWAQMLNRPVHELRRYNTLRVQAAESFEERFWYAAGGYLYDSLDGSQGHDAGLRPNQIIAAALSDSPLTTEQRKSVVDVVAARLWTPRGLRTLDQADERYRGRYDGDVWSRDGSYHQGTVWPWLIGPFVDAHLLVYGDKSMARRYVEPFRQQLMAEGCVGSINEIFDGDSPHTPRGSVAQAWSVSEVFRAWMATAEYTPPGGA